MNFTRHFHAASLMLFCASVPLVQAELPFAKLNFISPTGAQAGKEVVVTLNGTDLEDAKQLIFSDARIQARPKLQDGSTNIEPNKFVVSIPVDFSPALTDVRVAGRFGVSNPRPFAISTSIETNEVAGNNTFEKAMEIRAGTVINGATDNAAADFFQFNVAKGKKLVVRCEANSLDSRLSPVLVLQDATGKEVARSRRVGLLEWAAPEDGKVTLRIFDQQYRGGPEFYYRLQAGYFPHIDVVEPAFTSLEGTNKFTLFGRNLPGAKPSDRKGSDGRPLEQKEIELPVTSKVDKRESLSLSAPKSSALDGTEMVLPSSEGKSNPYFIAFTPVSATNALQFLNGTNSIQKVSTPCHLQGMFEPGKDSGIIFDAKKGEVHWIEIASDRLGYPTDPMMLLQRVTTDEKGNQKFSDIQEVGDIEPSLGGIEWDTVSYDGRVRFEAKEDGTYRVLVRDLFNRTRGKPSYPFQLSIRPESPDFRIVALPIAPPDPNKELKIAKLWSTFLRKGERSPMRIVVFREHNFNGEIQLSADGLPTGVDFAPKTIPAGVSSATIIFSAAENASPFAGHFKLKASAEVGGKKIEREARAGTLIRQVDDYNQAPIASRLSANLALAVAEKELAPLAMEIANPVVETAVAGKVQIPIQFAKHAELSAPIKFRLITEPSKEFEVPAAATNAVLDLDLTQQKFPAGTHTLLLMGQTQAKYRRISQPEVQEVEAQIKAANDAIAAADKEIASLNEKAGKGDKAAAEMVKAVQGRKDASANQVKALQARIQPADVPFSAFCQPITLKVAAAPIQLALGTSRMEMKKGNKVELPVQLTRMYGFQDAVDVQVVLPSGLKGISSAKLAIPQNQTEGKLVIETSQDVAPGEQRFTVQASLKFNNQDLKIDQPVTLLVAAN